DAELAKSSRSIPTSSSRLIYAALAPVGIPGRMPWIASRGHSVMDTLSLPVLYARDRDAAAIILVDLHGKREPGLYAAQLQRRFRLLVIPVVLTQFALTEPCADPVGRSAQQRFERTFDSWIAHYPVGIQTSFIRSGGNRIRHAAQAVDQAEFNGLPAAPYAPLADAIHLRFRQAAAIGHTLEECIVDLVDLHLEDLPFVCRKGPIDIRQEVGIFACFHLVKSNAQLIVIQFLHVGDEAKHPNRTGNRVWFGKNRVGRSRDIVPSRGSYIPHGDDYRLFPAQQFHLAPDDVGSQRTATG